MYNNKEVFKSRNWLNELRSEDTGAVSVRVEADMYGVDAYITLRDCRRQIELDFCFDGEKQLKDRIRKANLLIDSIDQMKDALDEALKVHKKERAAYEKEQKKKKKNL